jgi:hypothetical protein
MSLRETDERPDAPVPSAGRFYLDQDDDSHWYVIPADRATDWEDWCDSGAETVPEWAQRVGGAHTLVTFTDPVIA